MHTSEVPYNLQLLIGRVKADLSSGLGAGALEAEVDACLASSPVVTTCDLSGLNERVRLFTMIKAKNALQPSESRKKLGYHS